MASSGASLNTFAITRNTAPAFVSKNLRESNDDDMMMMIMMMMMMKMMVMMMNDDDDDNDNDSHALTYSWLLRRRVEWPV